MVFVYAPLSGSRVFARAEATEIIVRTALRADGSEVSGSLHVDGGPHLWWLTAVPRQHWRDAGRATLAAMVSAYGGIAWDDRGNLHWCGPASAARAVCEAMRATRTALGVEDTDEALRLEAALIAWPEAARPRRLAELARAQARLAACAEADMERAAELARDGLTSLAALPDEWLGQLLDEVPDQHRDEALQRIHQRLGNVRAVAEGALRGSCDEAREVAWGAVGRVLRRYQEHSA